MVRASSDHEPDPHDIARQIVLRQLTNAPKSRSQLAQALAKRGCDPEVAARVLDRLERVGLVDDAAYAAMVVRSKQARLGLAKRALAHELRAKGIGEDIAQEALGQINSTQEEEQARALLARRLKHLHGVDRAVQTRRLAGLLARKGYPGETSMRVIREVLDEAAEHRRD